MPALRHAELASLIFRPGYGQYGKGTQNRFQVIEIECARRGGVEAGAAERGATDQLVAEPVP